MALSRLEYQPDNATVSYHSDKPTGPTAGRETMDVLEFLARVTSHIPAKCQVAPALLWLVRITRLRGAVPVPRPREPSRVCAAGVSA